MRAMWVLPVLVVLCVGAGSNAKSIFDDVNDAAKVPAPATRPAAADVTPGNSTTTPPPSAPAAASAGQAPAPALPAAVPSGQPTQAAGAAAGAAPTLPLLAPAPGDAALAQAIKLIGDVYQADIAAAATPAAKRVFSQKLIDAAATEQDRPTQFALFLEARRFAAAANDCALAFGAVERLEQIYQADGVKLRFDTIKEMEKTAQTSADRLKLASGSADAVEKAIEGCRYDIARAAAAIESKAAHLANSPSLTAQAAADAQSIREAEAAHARCELALAILKSKPTDAAANLTVGKFICFARGDMETGLPYLARGSDPFLKDVAVKDLAQPADPGAQMDVGDGWWEMSALQAGAAKRHMRNRAESWYSKAAPLLDGLRLKKVQQRLDSLKASTRHGLAVAQGDAPDAAGAPVRNQTPSPDSRQQKIAEAIRNHRFALGMTLEQASQAVHTRGAMLNEHMYVGHERKTYRFARQGVAYLTYIERGAFMYELHHSTPMAGIVAYVEATFDDDALISYTSYPGGRPSTFIEAPQ